MRKRRPCGTHLHDEFGNRGQLVRRGRRPLMFENQIHQLLAQRFPRHVGQDCVVGVPFASQLIAELGKALAVAATGYLERPLDKGGI